MRLNRKQNLKYLDIVDIRDVKIPGQIKNYVNALQTEKCIFF